MHNKVLNFPTMIVSVVSLFCVANAGGQGPPTYYASQGHYWPQSFQSLSENRTLTGIVSASEGEMKRIVTTGGFVGPYQPLVNESSDSVPGGHDWVLSRIFGGFRVPTTENGHTMLWVGTTSGGGSPQTSSVAIWKADGTFIIHSPILGARELIPRDMNESLRIAGNLVTDVDRLVGSDWLEIPVIMKLGGGVSVVEPSRVAAQGYGYETIPREGGGRDRVIKDNGAVAMAINNSGAVVCDAYGSIYTDGFEFPQKEYWSFVSLNGSITAAHLPQGATDINDNGDVVGYNRNIGTWIALGGGEHTVIDTLTPDTAYSVYRPRINNDRTVTWTGGDTTRVGFEPLPVRVWREGQIYEVALLIETNESFELEDVVDMNEAGDLLVRVRGEIDWGAGPFTVPYHLILSQRPFPQELIVNVTGDEADADPDDQIIDTDLTTSGAQISLRAAIDAVNNREGTGIKFDIPGGGVPRIILTDELPPITEPIVIDGTSQPGGEMVEIRGDATIPVGLHVSGGETEVRGLVLTGFTGDDAVALKLSGPGKNRVVGNHFGVDSSGNASGECTNAIEISNCPENQIGGTDPDDQNILHADSAAVRITGADADNNQIEGNRIGMGADGSILGGDSAVGVFIAGGDGNVVGSNGAGGNRIASATGVVVAPDDVAIVGLIIQGNRIGLDGAGVHSSALGGRIILSGSAGGELTGAQVIDNRIAGGSIGIWVLETTGTEISRNRIGLRFDGVVDVPSGIDDRAHRFGVRLDRAEGVQITNNTIAGHRWDILVSGTLQVFTSQGMDPDDPSDDFVFTGDPDNYAPPDDDEERAGGSTISSNTLGIADGEKPPGFTALSGVLVFGEAPNITIANNTIAGHVEGEVVLVDGTGHEVRGNLIGTDSGGANFGNSLAGIIVLNADNCSIGTESSGNTIGHNFVGVAVVGEAVGTKVVGNEIGVAGPANNIPNQTGIRVAQNEDDDDLQPDQTTIEGNTIGRAEYGLDLESGGLVRVIGNRIGARVGGAPAPNLVGVFIEATTAILRGNTIAHNAETGIQIDGDSSQHPVSIESSAIFGNGDSESDGIYYETSPFEPPAEIRALRSTPTNGIPGTAVFAIPAAGVEGDVIYELYGNPKGANPQGEVPLLRRQASGMQPFAANLSFTPGSALASLSTFRVTMTVGMQTSEFSVGTMSEVFEWPQVETNHAVESDAFTIRWRGEDYFHLETLDEMTETWSDVNIAPTDVGGVKEVTVPVGKDTELFRLRLDTDALLSK